MSEPFTICFIDNDEVYQYMFTRSLKAHELTKKISTFPDGEQAISFLKANIDNKAELPDIIFLDINMPIMDGWQFIEEYIKIKPRIGKQVTIYLITSSTDAADIEQAKKIGEISDYLVKPINPDMLKAILNNLKV